MSCDENLIPKHLHLNGRVLINEFSEETLYRRFEKSHILPSGEISVSIFDTREDSVNRSAFSEPNDVLYNTRALKNSEHFFNWGIVGVSTELFKEKIFPVNDEPRIFQLIPNHCPEECMYPHSQIEIFENGNRITKGQTKPKSIKTAIRSYYREIWQLYKMPD